jgi:hypothetical protein
VYFASNIPHRPTDDGEEMRRGDKERRRGRAERRAGNP